jgi:dihydrofolate reductase
MGRKTWESLPFKPLPKRRNIVLSSQEMENIESYTSVDECIKNVNDESEIFIIGGAQIYEAFFPLAHQLHITMVDKKTSGVDTFFPISMEEIKLKLSMSEKNRLTDIAMYTHWKKS